ncbi:hypothetical protein ACLMJK_005213 [Lecanora helva]
MADPLSIATGVVGLLTATAKISSLLIQFSKSSKDAPAQAQTVIIEVNEISIILSHLQSFLLAKETAEPSRASLLQVDQVVVILSGCVMTFSELERLLDEMKAGHMSVLDRMKWARKEREVLGLVQRLQSHKASLSLILNILNGDSIAEAKGSVDRLFDLVDTFYQAMSSRVQALELRDSGGADASPSLPSYPQVASEVTSEFWQELENSRVYRRISADRKSIFSTDQCTITSRISGFSIAEISNLSVVNLVVTSDEVHNPLRRSQTWLNGRDDTFQIVNKGTSAIHAQNESEHEAGALSAQLDGDSSSVETITINAKDVEATPEAHSKMVDGADPMLEVQLIKVETARTSLSRTEGHKKDFTNSLGSKKKGDNVAYRCNGCYGKDADVVLIEAQSIRSSKKVV